MLRSMYSAVSGLKAHQARMDVIGNNIANVNTVGYKASRMTFKRYLARQSKVLLHRKEMAAEQILNRLASE